MIEKCVLKQPKFWVVLFFFIFTGSKEAKAQIPTEVLVGQNQLQHEFFFFKDIDTVGKVNLFSMARFAVDYQDSDLNASFISSQVTYNFNTAWGVSGGAIYDERDFVPLIALSCSYFNKKGDLFINLFPTLLISEKMEYEMFGLFFYTPKISENISLFSQVIFGNTFNNDFSEHLFSYQQTRLGVGIKDWFQTGVGIDQNFFGIDFQYSNNIGLFLRKEL